jgi:transposase-like protein
MARHETWDEATKAKAMTIARNRGVRAAGRETGVSPSTISRWLRQAEERDGVPRATDQQRTAAANEASVRHFQDRRQELADSMADTIAVCAVKAKEAAENAKGFNAHHLAIAAAVFVDKAMMLTSSQAPPSGALVTPAERIDRLMVLVGDLTGRDGQMAT